VPTTQDRPLTPRRPRTRPLRLLANLAVTAVLTAVVAAATAGSVRADSFLRTEAYAFFTGYRTESWCLGDYEARLDGADLRGPHFAVTYLCRFIEDDTPAAVHAEFAGTPALAEGTELIVAQAALAPIYEPEAEEAAVDVWIEAGEQRIDLAGLPESWAYVAIAVPAGEDAVLWVEDDGRAQGLSLRTGARVEPVASYYNGIGFSADGTARYEFEDVRFGDTRYRAYVRCSGHASATRQAWHPELGWAAEGTSFLTVKLNWCHLFENDSGEEVLQWDLHHELSLVSADGDPIPLLWDEEPVDNKYRLLVTAVFAVPDDLAEVRLDFTPFGDLHNLREGGEFHLADTPDAVELAFSF